MTWPNERISTVGIDLPNRLQIWRRYIDVEVQGKRVACCASIKNLPSAERSQFTRD
jgi:hypothetical protein